MIYFLSAYSLGGIRFLKAFPGKLSRAVYTTERIEEMRKGIHPKLFKTKVTCSCGEEFVTHSTKKTIKLEICSKCHPYFTGQRRLVDSAGRVEKFTRKYARAKKKKDAQ